MDVETANADRRDPVLLRPLVCTAVGMAGNLLLTAGKLAVGLTSHSASLVADGFHSFSDLASDVGVIIALKASGRPPDRNHPYGHHNYETLGALAASLLLLGTGVLLGKSAVEKLLAGASATPSLPALAAAVASIVIKEAMARYTYLAARLHNSPALRSNGAHHRSDALSSVAAVIGISGALLGAPFLDSLAALAIAVLIAWMGWGLLKDNTDILMETRPREELLSLVRDAALTVPGVEDVSFLVVRPRGSVYLADISVTVRPDMTVAEGHDRAHAVEAALRGRVKQLIGVTVHVEPHTGPETSGDDP